MALKATITAAQAATREDATAVQIGAYVKATAGEFATAQGRLDTATVWTARAAYLWAAGFPSERRNSGGVNRSAAHAAATEQGLISVDSSTFGKWLRAGRALVAAGFDIRSTSEPDADEIAAAKAIRKALEGRTADPVAPEGESDKVGTPGQPDNVPAPALPRGDVGPVQGALQSITTALAFLARVERVTLSEWEALCEASQVFVDALNNLHMAEDAEQAAA